MKICNKCGGKVSSLKTVISRVNKELHNALVGKYPITQSSGMSVIEGILNDNGLFWDSDDLELKHVTYETGQTVRVPLSGTAKGKWLDVRIYRMPSGNYEFTASVS